MSSETDKPTDKPTTDKPGERPSDRHRAIVDAPSLQALAHPTRLALMEAIAMAGALTATQASGVVGESPTACAYHLRMLARLGFIEEAGGARGRQRPWQLAQAGMSIETDPDNPAASRAADALSKALFERFISRIRRYELTRSRYPAQVREVTGVQQSVLFTTPEEFRQAREEIFEVLSRYNDRLDPALRPPGSYPFEIITFAHVYETPTAKADDAQPPPDS